MVDSNAIICEFFGSKKFILIAICGGTCVVAIVAYRLVDMFC